MCVKAQLKHRRTDPELVIMAWWTFLDEGSVVGGNVSVVRVLLQHVDFQLNFLLFILQERGKHKVLEMSHQCGYYG